IAAAALALMFALAARRIAGAVLIAIVAATATAIVLHLEPLPAILSLPPSLRPTLLQMSFGGVSAGAIATAVFAFLLVDMLDTSGTLTAVAHQAKLLAPDEVGTMSGAAIGTSPVTAYIESAAGVQAGGRTGLTAVAVAALFLLSL